MSILLLWTYLSVVVRTRWGHVMFRRKQVCSLYSHFSSHFCLWLSNLFQGPTISGHESWSTTILAEAYEDVGIPSRNVNIPSTSINTNFYIIFKFDGHHFRWKPLKLDIGILLNTANLKDCAEIVPYAACFQISHSLLSKRWRWKPQTFIWITGFHAKVVCRLLLGSSTQMICPGEQATC